MKNTTTQPVISIERAIATLIIFLLFILPLTGCDSQASTVAAKPAQCTTYTAPAGFYCTQIGTTSCRCRSLGGL